MPELNPKHMEVLINFINQGAYFRHMSMRVQDIGMGYSLIELDVGNAHLTPLGEVHGGIYASVIDQAAYWASYCELDEGSVLISIDLKVDYLASTSAGLLIVKGRRIKMGKTLCLAEAAAYDNNDRLLAHGISKLMVTQGPRTIKDAIDLMGADYLPPKFL